MKIQSKFRTKATNKRGSARRVSKTTAPRSTKEFFARPAKFQQKWELVTQAVSVMRADRLSLAQAAREFGVDPRAVIRLAGSALRKKKNGRYTAKAADRLSRILVIPTPEGLREIAVRDSREATKLGEYWNAVQRYLQIGDASALEQFRSKRITDADGIQSVLLTELKVLDRLGGAGVLSFESVYARGA